MKLLHATVLMLLVSVNDIKCEPLFSYDGYKVYDVKVSSRETAEVLQSLDGHRGVDFWSNAKILGSTSRVMVQPEYQEWFQRKLDVRKVRYEVTIEDLERTFATGRQYQLSRSAASSSAMSFNRYYQHTEINEFLESLDKNSLKNPQVKVSNAGKSFEGRDIKIISITNGDGREKNSIFIDAGIHAREWIAPATALYFITQLVDPQSDYSKLLDEVDFVIMPVVNPDGYQYSHKRDRMWRKTRSTRNVGCVGVDGNRNFDFHWGEGGASSNPCSYTYKGRKPFSEKETQVLRDVVTKINETCKFYLTLHSYGNYMLYPWGYTSDLPGTWRDLDDIAQAGARAIKQATGTEYTVGSSTNVLYAAAGGSDDYMFGVANIPISITMELPGGGNNGFDPPAAEIEKSVKESAIGIFEMSRAVAKKYRK